MANYRTDSTIMQKMMCAIVFSVFIFTYLYFYQTPTLMFAQHQLSGGVTYYAPLFSSLILTAVAMIVQQCVAVLLKLKALWYPLSYFPPIIGIALMTGIRPSDVGGVEWGTWIYFFPLLIVLYIVLIFIAKKSIVNISDTGTLFSSPLVMTNAVMMIAMMLFLAYIGNGDKRLHTQILIENYIRNGQYEMVSPTRMKQLEAYNESFNLKRIYADRIDSTITMLEFYAMAKRGSIADSIFNYSVRGGVRSLLEGKDIHLYLIPAKRIIRRPLKEYSLCAFLADGNLDLFAYHAKRLYAKNDTFPKNMPRHFKEALVLYQHQHAYPLTNYNDTVLEADYEDMQSMIRSFNDKDEQYYKIANVYGNTYWAYYFFRKK